ncbi:MAG: OmpA family protein [Alphaproteobacteria bacterium]|nr:OmpA family protein [Alphaproteobacteria bacterium]
MKKISILCALLTMLCSCGGYKTPERGTWDTILKGASFGAMTETSKVAKKPIYLGAGGKTLEQQEVATYMSALEIELSDSLRKPGIQITRIGGDALVVMVRDAFMSLDHPDISSDGADTLNQLSKVLAKYDRTYIEIAGYSDAMRDQNSAIAFSFDMAERVALFMAQHKVKPVRMFVVGRGSARPISDQTNIGRLMNRRVEIRISPVTR